MICYEVTDDGNILVPELAGIMANICTQFLGSNVCF